MTVTDPSYTIDRMVFGTAVATRRARSRWATARVAEIRRSYPVPDTGPEATAGDIVIWLVKHRPIADETFEYVMLSRRQDAARILYVMAGSTLFPKAQLARLARMVWVGSVGFREAEMPPELWVSLFRAVGYIDGGKVGQRPAEMIELYRGCVPAAMNPETGVGMTWTPSAWYASAYAFDGERGNGRVFRATVEPDRLLLTDATCDEGCVGREYIVDVRGLAVETYAERIGQRPGLMQWGRLPDDRCRCVERIARQAGRAL